jgi:4-aminobutyrate aminotransferase-like enzyme
MACASCKVSSSSAVSVFRSPEIVLAFLEIRRKVAKESGSAPKPLAAVSGGSPLKSHCASLNGTSARWLQSAGQGSILYDSNGKEYIDFFAGIAVNALGHSDPQVAQVIAAQANKVQHLSNILHSHEPLALAKTLVEGSRYFQKVFFCNSGTEANEGALKIAKKFHLNKAMKAAQGIAKDSAQQPTPYTAYGCKGTPPTQCFTQGGVCGCWPTSHNNDIRAGVKNEVLAFKNSFHGRTMGALAATHKPAIRMPFGPFPAEVQYARFNNLDGE